VLLGMAGAMLAALIVFVRQLRRSSAPEGRR
jgi:hypothetical protein